MMRRGREIMYCEGGMRNDETRERDNVPWNQTSSTKKKGS